MSYTSLFSIAQKDETHVLMLSIYLIDAYIYPSTNITHAHKFKNKKITF